MMKSDMLLNLPNLQKWDKKVATDPKYGKEQMLIEQMITKYPSNKDLLEIAMKVSLIDLTNSTQLTNYKSKLSLYDVAEIILSIQNIDERIKCGDVALVSELARLCKNANNGNGVNLFSFASKYCFYHNRYAYGRCDYSIYDNVVAGNLYKYATKSLPLSKTKPDSWRINFQYEVFHSYIGNLLDEYGITSSVKNRREMFDHFLWFANR